jgi:outer membrane protein OmpA-like peptidoglycan-associated protein
MKLRLALAAATCLALPIAAHAQPITGPYVSLEGGTSILNPENGNLRYIGLTGKALFKPSYSGLGAVGYGFGDGFRVELAGNFYRNYASKFDSESFGNFPLKGGSDTYGPMVNVLYDVDVGLPYLYPYLGVGAGYQYQHFDSYLKSGPTSVSGVKGSFAYNVIAGVSTPISAVPGLSLTASYRFMQLTESRNYGESYIGGLPPGNPDGGTAHVGQASYHTFLVGVTYALFQPAPPAPPTPPPVITPQAAPTAPPARTYLVFFDWDKSDLTARAVTIIAQAAADSKTGGTTDISVSGYTDTSGTPDYNQGLSERRAKAVSGQLVTDGVPASEIEIHAYGETHLLVPTGPGVREPQNRRVEIVLQ